MKRHLFLALSVIYLASCKSPSMQRSEVFNAPRVNNKEVKQGGDVIRNYCKAPEGAQSGHAGNAAYPEGVDGWKFNEAEGCFLKCRDEQAVKADFIRQLRAHRIYGGPEGLANDSVGATMRDRFQTVIRKKNQGVAPNSFANIGPDQVFDGAKWKDMTDKPQVGDLFINLNFGQPNHAGIFYSKRGLAHARLVVEVGEDHITLLDSGWEALSRATQINSQSVWLRPNQKYFDADDKARVARWGRTLSPVPYDNTLYDDWAQFRATLHNMIDEGTPEKEAAQKVFAMSKEQGFAPGGLEASFEFLPPSGMYCSEGPAAIFMYSGFRQHGETALDILRLFGEPDQLPQWSIYADALSGFGADSEESIYMMHKIFFSYFEAFDRARRQGLIAVDGMSKEELAAMKPIDALEANFRALEPHFMAGMQDPEGQRADPIATQLATARDALSGLTGTEAEQAKQMIQQLEQGLTQAAAGMSQVVGRTLSIGDAVYLTFYANKSYGPHTFFENSKYFDLKGVFYNTDLRGGYQALYIADWWLSNFEQGRQQANISTTLYDITEDESLPADRCVIAGPAPYMENHY